MHTLSSAVGHRCIYEHCDFLEHPEELIIFSSIPIVLDEIFKVIQDTWNEAGRLFPLSGLNTNAFFSPQFEKRLSNNNTIGCSACFQCKVNSGTLNLV